MGRTYPVTLADGEHEVTLQVDEEDYILDAAWQAGYDLPGSCLLGWCLTCAGRILAGEVDQQDSRRYYEADRQAGFALLCTAKPRSPLRILTHQKQACREHRRRLGLPTPRG